MKIRNRFSALTALAVGSLVPALSFAGGGGPDYSGLTDAVDFDDIAPIVLGVGAALMTLYVVIKAVKIAIGFVRGS